jgi:glycosyl transferase family 61
VITLAPRIAEWLESRRFEFSLERAASKSWVVEGPSNTRNRPACYDPADLEKITAPAPGSTYAYQLDRLTRLATHHLPLRAHLLRDVLLVDGVVIRWNLIHRLRDGPAPRTLRRPRQEFDRATLASSYLGNRFFGHWLLDDYPLALLGEPIAPPVGYLAADQTLTTHQREYEQLMGPVPRVDSAFFRELVVFDYCTESADKARRYATMSARLSAGLPPRDNAGVMLLRKDSGQPRVLVNEMEIAERMAARGFTVIDPQAADVPSMVEACLGARVLMGCEGSHLAHAFLPMRRDGTILVLQPPFKFDNFWRDRANSVGGRYASLIGDAVEGGFAVPADRVERMLDALAHEPFTPPR